MRKQHKHSGARNQVEENGVNQQECAIDEKVVLGDAMLSDDEIASLHYMIEEEKMAQDLYDALYEQTDLQIFDRISHSETRHMETLLRSADWLGVDTDFTSDDAGVFENEEIQTLYDTLLAQASASTQSALEVGYLVEQTDIEDLELALENNSVDLMGVVYNNLLNASENHLAAFEAYM